MNLRQDETADAWPMRPWIMAAICALAGLLFHLLTDRSSDDVTDRWQQAGATLVAVAALSFVMTIELRRWHWSLYFALVCGLVTALIGWFTASYNHYPTIFEWPFLSGLFAVLIGAPLFQTVRDEGAWRFPYPQLHGHAWTDAVIGAASLVFAGISFVLGWLIAALFDLIGIDLIKDLMNADWFVWMLAGFAFGTSVGLLRERDALVATLQRLVMVVLSVLAPILATALVIFLVTLPFSGFDKPNPWATATPLMLSLAAAGVLFANAVIGNGSDDRATRGVLRVSATALLLCVLPLAAIAAYSMGQRIGQYGWTPERIWGAVAVGVALGYGVAGWWAVGKGRIDFDDVLRPLQTRLALAVCGLAVLLALPILDFGAISASSQIARFADNKVSPEQFDWEAMAFNFGPAGRKRLAEIAKSGPPDQRKLAAVALAATTHYDVETQVEKSVSADTLDTYLRVVPEGTTLTAAQRDAIAASPLCRELPCVVTSIDPRGALIVGRETANGEVIIRKIAMDEAGKWSSEYFSSGSPANAPGGGAKPVPVDLATALVEVRPVTRRQLFVGDKPVGKPFE